jgi:hypothetical protein
LPPSAIQRIKEKSDRTAQAFRPAVWQGFWESVERFDGSPHLRATRIPVFAAYGAMGRTASTETLLMMPPNPAIATFWIAGAGHYLPHERPLEAAGICAQLIQQGKG